MINLLVAWGIIILVGALATVAGMPWHSFLWWCVGATGYLLARIIWEIHKERR